MQRLLFYCRLPVKNNSEPIVTADPVKDIEQVKLVLKTILSLINSFTTGIAGRYKARPNGRDA